MPRVMENNAAMAPPLTRVTESFRKVLRRFARAGIQWSSTKKDRKAFATMDVALYSSGHGMFVLVPACMHPPKVAEHLYGPLEPCAHSELARFDEGALRTRIEGEIDLHAYALVSPAEARRALGPQHACFRKRPQGLIQRLRRGRTDRATP